jgi:hypothetical protein
MRITGLVALAAAALTAAPPATASTWIDSIMGELKPEEKVIVADPQPVQLLVEWRNNGGTDPKATAYTTPMVAEEVKASRVFGAISQTPVANGAKLSILVNDVTDNNAARKGFTAGLTFGIAGVVAGDNYDITIRFVPARGAAPITRTLHHRLVTKFGNKTLPPNLVQVKSVTIGVQTIIRQFVAHGLNDIAKDPAFPGDVS